MQKWTASMERKYTALPSRNYIYRLYVGCRLHLSDVPESSGSYSGWYSRFPDCNQILFTTPIKGKIRYRSIQHTTETTTCGEKTSMFNVRNYSNVLKLIFKIDANQNNKYLDSVAEQRIHQQHPKQHLTNSKHKHKYNSYAWNKMTR